MTRPLIGVWVGPNGSGTIITPDKALAEMFEMSDLVFFYDTTEPCVWTPPIDVCVAPGDRNVIMSVVPKLRFRHWGAGSPRIDHDAAAAHVAMVQGARSSAHNLSIRFRLTAVKEGTQ